MAIRSVVKVEAPIETFGRAVYEETKYLVCPQRGAPAAVQPIDDIAKAALGSDLKGYFEAEWIGGQWRLGKRVSDRN